MFSDRYAKYQYASGLGLLMTFFVLWLGSKEEFQSFIEELNNNDVRLKFTSKCRYMRLSFLDVLRERGQNDRIVTDIYRKLSATASYDGRDPTRVPSDKGYSVGNISISGGSVQAVQAL